MCPGPLDSSNDNAEEFDGDPAVECVKPAIAAALTEYVFSAAHSGCLATDVRRGGDGPTAIRRRGCGCGTVRRSRRNDGLDEFVWETVVAMATAARAGSASELFSIGEQLKDHGPSVMAHLPLLLGQVIVRRFGQLPSRAMSNCTSLRKRLRSIST